MVFEFKCWSREGFLEEVEEFFNLGGGEVLFNDVLANFCELFFFRLKNDLERSGVVFVFEEELDFILLRKVRKFFEKNFYFEFFYEFDVRFEGFDVGYLEEVLGKDILMNYLSLNSESFLKDSKLVKKENEKILSVFEELKELDLFVKFVEFFKEFRKYSYFNFPNETGLKRFVFYFVVLNEKDKLEILEFFKSAEVDLRVISLFEKLEVFENGFLFAIGFNFEEGCLVRTTLYGRFDVFKSRRDNEGFLKKNFSLDYDFEEFFVKDWGVDFFENSECVKVYFKEKIFSLDCVLLDVLENKPCVGCLKFNEGELVDEKFEFSNNLFSFEEKMTLERFGVFEDGAKLFSVYFNKDGSLKNFVNYNI